MAYTTIDDPSAYFQIATYTGGGGNSSITNDGNSDLKPDLVYFATRNATNPKPLLDSTRGGNKFIYSDLTQGADTGDAGVGIATFNTDGFTFGSTAQTYFNDTNNTYVAWQWKCNGGTTSNLSGNLASVVQVNADAGFSIVTYTGSGGNGQSVLHGLGLTPEVIITKARNGADNWHVYHKSIGNTKILKLNTTDAEASSSAYSAAAVSSSAFFVSTSLIYVGQLGADFVSYCFAPIQGYSKFGKYVGNGNANGAFVYLGFAPAWLLIKRFDAGATNWNLYDNKRESSGGGFAAGQDASRRLFPNNAEAESANTVADEMQFTSNGFKLRGTQGSLNGSGNEFIYMAFAENPFVTSTGVPATAR